MFFLKILLATFLINIIHSTQNNYCKCFKNTLICTNNTNIETKCTQAEVNKLELHNINNVKILSSSVLYLKKLQEITINNSSAIFSLKKRQHVTLLPHITFLRIQANSLQNFPKDFFRQFIFVNLTNLEFTNNKLMTITETSFKYIQKITTLNLSFNNLKKLNESQFELLTELQYLNLSNNKIENLSELCFNNLQNILILDISYNRLLTLNNAINSLHNLNKLMLDYNYQLRDNVHIVTNSYLIHLQMVNISLKTVPKSIMTHSVVNLNISSNLLESLTDEDFDSVPLLRILDVSRNQIKTIESDALGRLELLEELYFSYNFITTIAPNLTPILRVTDFSYNFISTIENLEILDLSWNPIEKLPENLLINLKRLKTLKLAGLKTNQSLIPVPDSNSITSLDLSSSPSLAQEFLQNEAVQIAYKSITDLNLSFNSIEQLPSTISFEYLSELTCLKLDGNEILCDSLTNWTELIKWLEVRALNKMQIQCLITEAHKSKLIPLIEFYNSFALPIVLKHEETINRNFQFLQILIVLAMFSTLIISLVLIFFGKKWIDYSKKQDTETETQLTDFQELW